MAIYKRYGREKRLKLKEKQKEKARLKVIRESETDLLLVVDDRKKKIFIQKIRVNQYKIKKSYLSFESVDRDTERFYYDMRTAELNILNNKLTQNEINVIHKIYHLEENHKKCTLKLVFFSLISIVVALGYNALTKYI